MSECAFTQLAPMLVTMSECAFTQLALAPPTLVKALKQSAPSQLTQFATGCPVPGKAGTGEVDSALLDVLVSLPEEELSNLIMPLRARLDIDDKSLLGRIKQPSSSGVLLVESTPSAVDMDLTQEAIARKRRAEAKRDAEATMLSLQLKQGTKDIHAAAENVHFVREFISGRCSKAVYAAMLKDLYHVYVALEEAAERCSCDNGPFAPLHFPHELARVPSLESDLHSLFGPGWRTATECRPSKAAEAYAARLRQVSEERPELLVAHTYTRYLGDLSGGQILRRAVVRAYGLAPEGGTTLDARDGASFYDFPLIGAATRLRRFKDEYRATLDGLRVADEALVVAEAVSAFRRNTALLKEIDAVVLGAEEAAERHARPSSGPPPPNVCPFLAKTGDVAALGFGATCPVTGESAARKAVAANAGDAVCPLRAVGPRDLAIVAILFLAFACLLQGSPGLS